jgi:hypothetical protein
MSIGLAAPKPAGLVGPTVGALLVAACFLLPAVLGVADYGDACTRNTARLAVSLYFIACFAMLGLRAPDWPATSGRGRVARLLWSLGWAAYAVHVATAFHFAHGWSHAHAVEHVREASGWGEGIYFSHVFGFLWTADVVWWWSAPASYAARWPWVGRLLHAFFAFIVFNGAVVYETGPVRWLGAAAFLVLALRWLWRLVSTRRSGISPEERRAMSADVRSAP